MSTSPIPPEVSPLTRAGKRVLSWFGIRDAEAEDAGKCRQLARARGQGLALSAATS